MPRGDEQAEDEGSYGRDQTHHRLHNVLGFTVLMMLAQFAVEDDSCDSPAEGAPKYNEGNE